MSQTAWKGRTEFEDLFALDAEPPPLRGGVDAKLEHLREKLRRMEATVANAKRAWHVREREMDHIEALLDKERDRADAATNEANQLGRQLHELQDYLHKKKAEFDQFSAQLRSTFAERHDHEARMRAELDAAKAEYDDLAEEADEKIEALRSRVIRLDDELQLTVREREAREEEAEQRIGELQSWASELERDFELSRERARKDKGDLNRELLIKNRELKKWQERAERYQRRVHRRDRTIEKLEATVEQRIPEWTIYAMALAAMALILFVGIAIATPTADQTVEALCLVARPTARNLTPMWITLAQFFLIVIAIAAGAAGVGWAVWVRRAPDGHKFR